MVSRASAVLSRRALAALALFALLVAYDETSTRLWHAGIWWDVVWVACVLLPSVFGLVWLALPLRPFPAAQLAGLGVAFAALSAALVAANADVWANFGRLAASSLLGWAFLGLFEQLSWVVLVAVVVPWVDAYSVWRGPTKTITENHPHVFDALSFAFPVPGSLGAFQLGVPDLLFFALFLGAADRFRLRVGLTWLCLVALLGATMAITVWLDLSGLPALPAVALGFLLPNADLIWRSLRGQDGSPGSVTART